ncbi:tripartite tricarboxylate transporter TctB family protein [Nocardioides euryhalodurans]|nr:tripartite tricarboxylate transporter TctB family protein [Nocardioides euryhalodurans]
MALPDLLQREHAPAATTPSRERFVVRVLPELGALLLVAVLWPRTAGMTSSAGGPGPAFVPQLLLGVLAASALVGVLLEVRRRLGGHRDRTAVAVAATDPDAATEGEEPTNLRRALLAAALVLTYVAATALLGWLLASTAFALVFLRFSGHRRPWPLVAVAVVAPQVLAYVFVKVVYIALPTGVGVFDTVTVALYRLFGIY